ncbi:hypothetical protein SBA3_60015 [Candidatus Sulfopaludibacter sp. SbA3]|nr:hypothetical protein SBA3_60015 [Candidatus Sulfopaludibacter sp. SbA3]
MMRFASYGRRMKRCLTGSDEGQGFLARFARYTAGVTEHFRERHEDSPKGGGFRAWKTRAMHTGV